MRYYSDIFLTFALKDTTNMNINFRILGIISLALLFFVACNSGGSSSSLQEEVKAAEEALKNNPSGQLDIPKAEKAVEVYEKYAAAFPDDAQTPELLFKSAEIYRSLQNSKKALEVYQKIFSQYGSSERAPVSLFLMAFCYENELKDKDKAKSLYEEFMQKYPSHELAKSAQFALSNIDKTPEEILKEFEAKAKQNGATATDSVKQDSVKKK